MQGLGQRDAGVSARATAVIERAKAALAEAGLPSAGTFVETPATLGDLHEIAMRAGCSVADFFEL